MVPNDFEFYAFYRERLSDTITDGRRTAMSCRSTVRERGVRKRGSTRTSQDGESVRRSTARGRVRSGVNAFLHAVSTTIVGWTVTLVKWSQNL